jgi:3-hydroxyisobutyrate dehydrogenase-like beta-hydroxyacid dehydrogenase
VTNVAVLGAGALGSAIAAHLSDEGFDVRLWNRTLPGRKGSLRSRTGLPWPELRPQQYRTRTMS